MKFELIIQERVHCLTHSLAAYRTVELFNVRSTEQSVYYDFRTDFLATTVLLYIVKSVL